MNDDLDQLLKNLKLRRMREVLPDELQRAEKKKPSYSEFLARVLREEYHHQQARFLECVFRLIAITQYGAWRSLNTDHRDHRFRHGDHPFQ